MISALWNECKMCYFTKQNSILISMSGNHCTETLLREIFFNFNLFLVTPSVRKPCSKL